MDAVACGTGKKQSSARGLARPADINLKLGGEQRSKELDLAFNRMSPRLDDRFSKSCSSEHLVAFWTARLLLGWAICGAAILEDERIGV